MNTTSLSLEERVTRLEDMEAIRQLVARYAHNLDDGYNPEGVAAVFAVDGQWIIEGEALKGREAIKNQCVLLTQIAPWTMHCPTTETIEVDGAHADCTFYGQALQTMENKAGGKDAYIFLSVYKAKCVKTDGKWYFAQMQADTQQTALWSAGWVKSPSFEGFFKVD